MKIQHTVKMVALSSLMMFFAACDNPLTNSDRSVISDDFDNNETVELPSVSFKIDLPLSLINSISAPNYPVSGTCDPNGEAVITLIGSPDVNETTSCGSDGTFSTTLDVTGVTDNPPTISVSQGESTATVPDGSLPLNDQTPIVDAPVATPPALFVGGPAGTYDLPISCSEAGEVVSITGLGLDPDPQSYTCTSVGSESFPLTLANLVETSDPNPLTISSTDANGNPTTNTSEVSVPVDTQGPSVAVVAGSNITQGQTASFTVTLTDINLGAVSYSVATSGAETGSYNCTANPCTVTTAVVAAAGELTLTVAVDAVSDSLSNTNTLASSDSLTVTAAGTLAFNDPVSVISSQNAASYPVSGSCDDSLGDVTVTIGTPDVSQSFPCTAPGTFTGTMPSLAGVTSNPPSVSVSQGVNSTDANPLPVNDQTPIASAPTVADQSAANGTSTMVSVTCTEVGEVLTFTNAALDPNPQMYTCAETSAVDVTLTFATGQETADPNNVTLSSVDANGNATTNSTMFNLPIDNVAPTVAVAAGADIVDGDTASFTVTVTDGGTFTSFTPTVTSGAVSSGACTASPCTVTVTGAAVGTLTLTVAIASVLDAAGNSNALAVSDTLEVAAGAAPTITAINDRSCITDHVPVSTFTIDDTDSTITCTGNVLVASSNTALVAGSGIQITGTGTSCSITITPEADQTGSSTITLSVTDGSSTTSTSYTYTAADDSALDVLAAYDVKAWYLADRLDTDCDVNTPLDGESIEAWQDQSGNANDLTGKLNGGLFDTTKGAVEWNNIVQPFTGNYVLTDLDSLTIFNVIESGTATNNSIVFETNTPRVAFGRLLTGGSGTPLTNGLSWDGGDLSGLELINMEYNGANATQIAYRNGSLNLSRAGAVAFSATQDLFLGDDSTGGNRSQNGDFIYETIIINEDLSIADREYIEGYLACKWSFQGSLPADHTYKTACPTAMATALVLVDGALEPSDGNYERHCEAYRRADYYNNEGDGTYRIDPDGAAGPEGTLTTYCDMDAAGAWTLLASTSVGDNTTPLVTDLVDTDSNGILGQLAVEGISSEGIEVRINSLAGSNEVLEVTTADAAILGRLQSYLILTDVNCGDFNNWLGDFNRLSCPSASNTTLALSDSIYHAVGNSANLHWIPSLDRAGWASGGLADVDNMNLWVRHAGLIEVNGAFEYAGGSFAANCLEYLNSVEYDGEGDALYWIDPDGAGGDIELKVHCDMTYDGGGWTRVFNHDVAGGFFTSEAQATNNNSTDPENNMYSILDQMASIIENPAYEFYQRWPGDSVCGNTPHQWMQTSDPLTTTEAVSGYVNIAGGTTQTAGQRGLCRARINGGLAGAYFASNCGHNNWFYAIGSRLVFGPGIPTCNTPGNDTVELFVR